MNAPAVMSIDWWKIAASGRLLCVEFQTQVNRIRTGTVATTSKSTAYSGNAERGSRPSASPPTMKKSGMCRRPKSGATARLARRGPIRSCQRSVRNDSQAISSQMLMSTAAMISGTR